VHDILIEKEGSEGIITLNRPKALNALTLNMIVQISRSLDDLAADDQIRSVIFKGAGDRAFCAGGDIKAAYEMGRKYRQDRQIHPHLYFGLEYQMNRKLFHFLKPLKAEMDGIVMGGGFGIAGPCGGRLITNKSVFAMPEVGIGLFPDVGSVYFLNKCPGDIGAYLVVTGKSIGPADILYAGLATGSDEEIEGEGEWERLQDQIDRHFKYDSAEEIVESLGKDSSDWARETKNLIETRSPTSLKISLRHLRTCKDKSFDEVTQQDFILAHHVMEGGDFYEGVRAALIDKDKSPAWNPADLRDVKDLDVERYFEPFGLSVNEVAAPDNLI